MSYINKLALTFKSGIIYKTYDVGGMDDPFVQVKIGDVTKKTLAMINTTVPEWNETLIFENVKVKDAEGVWVTLWHSDAVSNDSIGSVCISALSTKHLSVSIVDEKGKDQATLEIDVAVNDDAAGLEEKGKVSSNARPADTTTASFSKYVDTFMADPADAQKAEKEKAGGKSGGKSSRSSRSPRGGGDDKKPSGSGSHSGVVYSTSESSPTPDSGSSSGSSAGVVYGGNSSPPERRPYNANTSPSSTSSTTTTGPDRVTTTTTYVTKTYSSSSSSTSRDRSPTKGTSPTAGGSSSSSKTSRDRSPAGGGGSSPRSRGAGEGGEGRVATKEVVIGGSGGAPARRPYIAEDLTPAYAEEVEVKEQKGSDTHMYHWLDNDSLGFTAGEQQLTVFLDFPITKDIWRIEAKFYHDDDHPGTTADFGVADSNAISKLYAKWLFNNADTCAYYLDTTTAKITAGKTHKSLLSAFFGRTGTKISVEIDMNERLLRFYCGNKLAPANIRIKPKSLHVGFSGRFAQRFENVCVRRLERPTLRPQDKPELLNWE